MIETHNINGEIIEWEVTPDEGARVRENPLDFPSFIQKKYFGTSADEFRWQDSFDGDVPEGFVKKTRVHKNPFTGETKEISYIEELPVDQVESANDFLFAVRRSEDGEEWVVFDDRGKTIMRTKSQNTAKSAISELLRENQ